MQRCSPWRWVKKPWHNNEELTEKRGWGHADLDAGAKAVNGNEALPNRSFRFLALEVVDWAGPIVEIRFLKTIESETDVVAAVAEASSFMRESVLPRADGAYFITCYDGLAMSPETLSALRERFIGFNDRYSRGDVRYGGGAPARTFVVSAAIQSRSRSNHYESRAEALTALRSTIRTDG